MLSAKHTGTGVGCDKRAIKIWIRTTTPLLFTSLECAEKAGVLFTDPGVNREGGAGVRRRSHRNVKPAADQGCQRLMLLSNFRSASQHKDATVFSGPSRELIRIIE